MAAFVRRRQRHDDEVGDARGDLLVAARTPIRLRRGVGLDHPHLRHRIGERVKSEARPGGAHRGTGWHRPLSPRIAVTGRLAGIGTVRYNGTMELPRVAVRLRIDGERGVSAAVVGELACAVEDAGAAALFVNGQRSGREANDPYVVLGAAAATTSRIGLGCLSSSIEERLPSILAKTLASLDLCCGGRMIACLTADFARGVDPAGSLVEAVVVLRAMLEVAGPSFHGEHFAISRAWNEPRMPRARRMPIGVAIAPVRASGQTATLQVAQMVVALAEHVDFVVADWRSEQENRATTVIPRLAVIDTSSPAEIGEETTSAVRAGCAGVVLDFLEVPEPSALSLALAVALEASGPFTSESG